MSKHVDLAFHSREEVVELELDDALHDVPLGSRVSPIADYFDVTSRLKDKVLRPEVATDAEMLGLMIIGVISAAEFYFRSILGLAVELCPLCAEHAHSATVPIGAYKHYRDSDFSHVLGSMEHESLAGNKEIRGAIFKFTGLDATKDSSLRAALDGFGMLCELRHCIAHARGFVGGKNSRGLQLKSHRFRKILLTRDSALDLLKLSHNTVRATNRFLANEFVDRWIDRDVLSGEWAKDKTAFTALWNAFVIVGEDGYGGNPRHAYNTVRPAIVKRQQAIAARVSAPAKS